MTARRMSSPIVVGVDGSAHSDLAVDWAAREAHLWGGRLHLVHATDIDWLVAATMITAEQDVSDDVLDAAVDRLRATHPDLEVTSRATTGAPAHDLVELSVGARLVVVGAHGRTPSHVPLGSVPHAVAMHASCPVVVVRPTVPAPAGKAWPVVVGVDGSPSCTGAIDFAFEEAARRGCGVTAVHAFWLEVVDGLVVTTPGSPQWRRASQEMHRIVSESLSGHCERYPDVDVSVQLVNARPADALATASQEASLVVVGARGRGGLAGMFLGSVSRELLMVANGPVAVVRPT
jgi:nucleotide-binding universal stress UspA family protein